MYFADKSLPELAAFLDLRLAVVGRLATSLEEGRLALLGHDAEAIARGAAHQAELCRQWGLLEDQLRAQGSPPIEIASAASGSSFDGKRSAQLDAEWQALRRRIVYLTRVHASLLRHMQRSLGILQRLVDSCALTYAHDPRAVARSQSLRSGG